MQPIKTNILIHASPEQVFDTFCELDAWWPMAYTFSGFRSCAVPCAGFTRAAR